MLAAGRGHAEVCRLLLEAGADPELRDHDGQDALAVAHAGRHSRVVALLAAVKAPAASGQDAVAPECAPPEENRAAALPDETEAAAAAAGDKDLQVALIRSPGVEAEPELASPTQGKPVVADVGDQGGDVWISEEEPASTSSAIRAEAGSEGAARSAPEHVLAAPSWKDGPVASSAESPAHPFWEAEPEPALSQSDAGVEETASAIDAGLTRHAAHLPDPDWLQTEIVLPDPAPSWAAAFVDPHRVYLTVISLLDEAAREGWLPEEEIAALRACIDTSVSGELLTNAVRAVLGDLGVIIEAEHALELQLDAARAPLDPDEFDVRSSDIAAAVDFIGGLSGDFLDAEAMLLDAAKRAPVLSAREEASLFRELASSLRAMLHLVVGSPSTIAILMRWADQLDAGELLPRDVSDGARGTSPTDAEGILNGADESGEIETSDIIEAGASDADMLASRLREVARKLMAGAPDAGLAFVGLSLANRRILELAEDMLPLDGRQRRRRGRTAAGAAGPAHLRILRRRPPGKAALPAQDIASAHDRYHAAREAIVEANLRRVVWFARRYARGTGYFLDLVQEGQIGLLRAIDRYDVGRGWRFGTYAGWWIRQSMIRSLQDTSRTVRIPVHLLERVAKTRRHAEAFRAKHGFEPSSFDLAQAAELDVQAVERALAAEREIVPLESVAGISVAEDDDQDSSGDFCTPEFADLETPLTAIIQTDLRQAVGHALRKLDPRHERVLRMRFGIGMHTDHTLEEIGQLLKLTRERIRQIEAKALERLPRQLPSRHFENMVP